MLKRVAKRVAKAPYSRNVRGVLNRLGALMRINTVYAYTKLYLCMHIFKFKKDIRKKRSLLTVTPPFILTGLCNDFVL